MSLYTCNCPYSIITCFSGNVYALKYIYWLDFSLLLPHFPHKDLGFFILGNHSFVVWKFFIFLISQTCHLEKLDELFLYTSKYPYSSFFFFPSKSYLQVVRLSHGLVCLLLHFLCPFKFWQTLFHWSTVQYQIAESKRSQWDCWQKLFLSFASLGALVLLVLSSPPISQSGEAAAFYLILMKYSPFVRSPVLENLVYFAFCFITVKERIQMSSLLSPPQPFLLESCTDSFPKWKLWISNTFSVWRDDSNLVLSETTLCNSSSGCTAENLSLLTSSLWTQPDFAAVSSFPKVTILVS